MLIKIFELWNLFENSAHNSFKLALRDFMSIVNSVSEFKFEKSSYINMALTLIQNISTLLKNLILFEIYYKWN